MSTADWLLSDFDEEVVTTRRFLERIPGDWLAWRPHAKSASLEELSSHIAELPGWAYPALKQNAGDYPARNTGKRESLCLDSVPAILDLFDRNCADGREFVRTATDQELASPWSPSGTHGPLFAGTRAAVFRRMVLRHLVHHRGQLSVYLRLAGSRVPPAYGGTADEPV